MPLAKAFRVSGSLACAYTFGHTPTIFIYTCIYKYTIYVHITVYVYMW